MRRHNQIKNYSKTNELTKAFVEEILKVGIKISDIPIKVIRINKLIEYIIVTDVYSHKINSKFTGKVVVLTGTLNNMSRDEAKNNLQSLGAKISNCLLYTSPSPRDRG